MEFLDKLLKTAEGVTKQLVPVEHQENRTRENKEYYHPEKKKYFSAPKIQLLRG
jgi:hypothetical protein